MTKIATEVNCATKNCVLPFTVAKIHQEYAKCIKSHQWLQTDQCMGVTVIISSAINPSAKGMAKCEVNLKKKKKPWSRNLLQRIPLIYTTGKCCAKCALKWSITTQAWYQGSCQHTCYIIQNMKVQTFYSQMQLHYHNIQLNRSHFNWKDFTRSKNNDWFCKGQNHSNQNMLYCAWMAVRTAVLWPVLKLWHAAQPVMITYT